MLRSPWHSIPFLSGENPIGFPVRKIWGTSDRGALPDRLRRAAHQQPRVAVHSLAGCFFYGAFVAKVLLVQSRRPARLGAASCRGRARRRRRRALVHLRVLVLQRGPAPWHVARTAPTSPRTRPPPWSPVRVLHASVHQMATPAARREDEPVHRPAARPRRAPKATGGLRQKVLALRAQGHSVTGIAYVLTGRQRLRRKPFDVGRRALAGRRGLRLAL